MNINYENFTHFADYLNNSKNANNKSIDETLKEYHNAYTTFLMTRKYNIDKIKYYRMNVIVDSFMYNINMNDIDIRKSLINYYIENIKDCLDNTLKPNACFFVKARLERQAYEKIDKYEKDTDEIALHYKGINDKNKYYYEKSIEIINDDNYSESYIENEYCDEDDYYSDYNTDDYYYDEYVTDYSTDYLSDEY